MHGDLSYTLYTHQGHLLHLFILPEPGTDSEQAADERKHRANTNTAQNTSYAVFTALHGAKIGQSLSEVAVIIIMVPHIRNGRRQEFSGNFPKVAQLVCDTASSRGCVYNHRRK